MVAAWREVIEPRIVPTDRLNDAYLAAVRARTLPGMLTPMEVIAAWRSIAEAEAVARSQEFARAKLAQLEGPRLSPGEVSEILAGVRASKAPGRVLGFTSAADAAASVARSAINAVKSAVEGD